MPMHWHANATIRGRQHTYTKSCRKIPMPYRSHLRLNRRTWPGTAVRQRKRDPHIVSICRNFLPPKCSARQVLHWWLPTSGIMPTMPCSLSAVVLTVQPHMRLPIRMHSILSSVAKPSSTAADIAPASRTTIACMPIGIPVPTTPYWRTGWDKR